MYFVAAWIAAGLLYPGYSQLTQATSELTSRGAPPAAAAVANLGLAAMGLCMIAFAFGCTVGYTAAGGSSWHRTRSPFQPGLPRPPLLSHKPGRRRFLLAG